MNAAAHRELHKADLRRRILAAARELFEHEGYKSFSMRRLAERIEYSPAAIYKHFKSKREIFEALAHESFQLLLATSSAVTTIPGEDPVDRLRRGMLAYVNFGLKNPQHYRFAFLLDQPQASQPPEPRPAYAGLRERVQLCIDAGKFRAGNVDLMAQSLWAAGHGIVSLLIQRPSFRWAARPKLIGQVIDSAIQGLLSHGE